MVLDPLGSDRYTITLPALAKRWGRSSESLRRRFHDGHLKGFQEGRSIRIFMSEVIRIECQRLTESKNIEESMPSFTDDHAFEGRLARLIGA